MSVNILVSRQKQIRAPFCNNAGKNNQLAKLKCRWLYYPKTPPSGSADLILAHFRLFKYFAIFDTDQYIFELN